MEEYIRKDLVLEEIHRLIDGTSFDKTDDISVMCQKTGAYFELRKLLGFIDSLDVKEICD